MTEFDVIVIGGGHNGLVCGAYLARAGMRTLVLEARASVGGCASTVNALGARVNICNCDHAVFRTTPIFDELNLASFGLRYLEVDPPQISVPWAGGPAWPIFHDLDRTIEGLQSTYPGEVDGYRRYMKAAAPVLELAFEAAHHVPRRRTLLGLAARRRGVGLTTLLSWSRKSAADVLMSFFRSDALRAPAAVVGPAVWGVSPYTPGTGLGALTYAMKHVASVGRPVGGSGALTDAIRGAFEAAGGVVRCDAQVTAIQCEGSRVRAVQLADGTEFDAPTVVSACDPHSTFLQWLRDPPPQADRLIQKWKHRPVVSGYESKIDAVVASPPHLRALDPGLPDRLGFDPLHATTIIAPGLDGIHAAHAAMAYGRVADKPMLFANVPSALDPTMRLASPESITGGDHVFSLEVLFTPYALTGGWPSSTEPTRWLEAFAQHAEPGFLDGVRRMRAMTPDRYEADFHLPKGHATSFAGGALAAFLGTDPELTRYHTPVTGLYLTGAATFPGAGVWGASGRNAAHVVIDECTQ